MFLDVCVDSISVELVRFQRGVQMGETWAGTWITVASYFGKIVGSPKMTCAAHCPKTCRIRFLDMCVHSISVEPVRFECGGNRVKLQPVARQVLLHIYE